jgi:hypothetical protein
MWFHKVGPNLMARSAPWERGRPARIERRQARKDLSDQGLER